MGNAQLGQSQLGKTQLGGQSFLEQITLAIKTVAKQKLIFSTKARQLLNFNVTAE